MCRAGRALAYGAAQKAQVDATLHAAHDGEVDLRYVRRQLLRSDDALPRALYGLISDLRMARYRC